VNWEDVKLTISTNNPYQNKTLPTMHPWYVDYYAYNQQKYIQNAPTTNNMNTGILYKEAEKKGFSRNDYTADQIQAET